MCVGDVLSALSKNATILSQIHNQNSRSLNKSQFKERKDSILAGHPLVPVPYRNSKLTHLLKDSLGN